MSPPELIVILPVYNESAVIARVAAEWWTVLDGLGIAYRLRLHNDGSRDGTSEILERLRHPCLEVIHAENRGHGPALLMEYRRAVLESPWVFQCDSDGELPAAAFPDFWARRGDADLIIGDRQNRGGPLSRRLITSVSRLLVRGLFGKGIRDVNCPYRLFRSQAFAETVQKFPDDSFAPNVLLSAHALRQGLRIDCLPVLYAPRQSGEVSIRRLRLLRAALKSGVQTLRFRWRGR